MINLELKNKIFFILIICFLLSSQIIWGMDTKDTKNFHIPFGKKYLETMHVLNQTCKYPSKEEKTTIPPNTRIVTLGNGPDKSFLPGEGIKASDVLESFLEKPTTQSHWVIDCRYAHEICLNICLMNALSKEKYNADFLKAKLHFSVFHQKYQQIHDNWTIKDLKKEGFGCYIMALEQHVKLGRLNPAIQRLDAGINLMSVGINKNKEMLFMGFDPLFFKDGPKTYEDIRNYFIENAAKDTLDIDFSKLKKAGETTKIEYIKNDYIS